MELIIIKMDSFLIKSLLAQLLGIIDREITQCEGENVGGTKNRQSTTNPPLLNSVKGSNIKKMASVT